MAPSFPSSQVTSLSSKGKRAAGSFLLSLLMLGVLLSVGVGGVSAACTAVSGSNPINWTDLTGNWSVASNWSLDCTPNNGGGVTYAATINSSSVTLDINATVDSLTLGNSASLTGGASNTLTTGALTNAGSVFFDNGNTLTVNGLTTNSSGGTLSLGLASTLQVNGDLSNSGFVATGYYAGPGTGDKLNVTGTFTNNPGGNLDLNGAGDKATVGALNNSGSVSVNPGATLTVNGAVTNSASVSVSGGTLAVSGGITNTGSLSLSAGSGTAKANVTTGNVTVSAGSVNLSGGSAASGTAVLSVAGTFGSSSGTTINLTGGSGANAQALITAGGVAQSTLTGNYSLTGGTGGAAVEYGSGGITQIGDGTTSSNVTLSGSNAFLEVGASNSNNALTGLANIAASANLILNNGVTVNTTVDLSNNGNLYVDNGGTGGSTLNIGGSLTNGTATTHYGTLTLGSAYISGANTAKVAVAGVLNNAYGGINIQGGYGGYGTTNVAGAQALMTVAGSGTSTNAYSLTLNGGYGGSAGSLGSVGGGMAEVNFTSASGTLNNTATINLTGGGTTSTNVGGEALLMLAGTLANTGSITLTGSAAGAGVNGAAALLNVAGGLTSSTLEGTWSLTGGANNGVSTGGAAVAEFGSGGITQIGGGSGNPSGSLTLNGPNAFMEVGNTNSNNALTGLTTIASNGSLSLNNTSPVTLTALSTNNGSLTANGTSVTTSSDLASNGTLYVDINGTGGSTLNIGGSLTNGTATTNYGTLTVGNVSISGANTAKVAVTGTLDNAYGQISLQGGYGGYGTSGVAGAQALMTVAGSGTSTNAYNLTLTGGYGGSAGSLGSVGGGMAELNFTSASGTLNNTGTINLTGGGGSTTNVGGEALLMLAGTLANTGSISLTGSAAGNGVNGAAALLNVAGAVPSMLAGTWSLTGGANNGASTGGAAVAEFGSGGITQIGDGTNSNGLTLSGPNAFMEVGNTNSNNALTGLASIAASANLTLNNGVTVNTTVDLSNNGSLYVDNGGTGGSTLNIGGSLTNGTATTHYGTLTVGNTSINGANTAKVAVAGVLNNAYGGISIQGGYGGYGSTGVAGAQALMTVAGSGTSTNAYSLTLNGGYGGSVGSPGSVGGGMAEVNFTSASGTLNNTATINLTGGGGSSTNVGGEALLMLAGTLANTGSITLTGSAAGAGVNGAAAILNVAGGLTSSTLEGTWSLTGGANNGVSTGGAAVAEFGSGGITQIGDGTNSNGLTLSGPNAFMEVGNTNSNNALTGLANIAVSANLTLNNGVTVNTTVDLSNNGSLYVDNGGTGGSTLNIGGSLTNGTATTHYGTLTVGNAYISGANTAKVAVTGTLDNAYGGIGIQGGYGGYGATNVVGAQALMTVAGSGTSTNAYSLTLAGGYGGTVGSLGSVGGGMAELNFTSASGTLNNTSSINLTGGGTTSTNVGGEALLMLAGTLANTGSISLTGSAAGAGVNGAAALLNVAGGLTSSTLEGTWSLTGGANNGVSTGGAAVAEFGSGGITQIGGGSGNPSGSLTLNGPNAFMEVGNTNSNNALTGLTTVASNGSLTLVNGESVTTSSDLASNGTLYLDNSGTGGSTLNIGGSLTNGTATTNYGTLTVGNAYISGANTAKVAVTGTLNNAYGGISLQGGYGGYGATNVAGAQALMTVAGSGTSTNAYSLTLTGGYGGSVGSLGSVGGGMAELDFTSASGKLNNTGSISLTGGGASSTNVGGEALLSLAGTLANTGSITIGQGATLHLNGSGASSNSSTNLTLSGGTLSSSSSSATFTNTGTLQTQSSPSTMSFGGTFTNAISGNVSGNLNLNVSGDATQFNTFANGGTVKVASGALLGIGSGTFGAGGGFQQMANGTFNEILAGTAVGSFGVINVTGNVALNGNIGVLLASNFTPGTGQGFDILNFTGTLTGQWSNVQNNTFTADGRNWTLSETVNGATTEMFLTAGQLQEIVATLAGTGNWTTDGIFSCAPVTSPCIPNNGATTFAVNIDSAGNTVTLDSNSTLKSVTIDTLSLQAGNLTIGTGATLNLVNQPNGGLTHIVAGAGLDVAGTFEVGGTTNALAKLAGVEGTLTLDGQTTNIGNALTVASTGVVNLINATKLTVNGDLGNSGTFYLGNGGSGSDMLTVTGTLINSGTFDLFGAADQATVNALNNTGSISVGNGTTLTVTQGIPTIAQNSSFNAAGTVNGFGNLTTVAGNLTLDNGQTITVTPGGSPATLKITSTGNLAVNDGGSPSTGTTLTVNGTVANAGNFSLSGNGTIANFTALNNTGSATVGAGTTLNLTQGITDIPVNSSLDVEGTINAGGNSALAGLSTVEGSLRLGNGQIIAVTPGGSPATLTVAGPVNIVNGTTVNVTGNVSNSNNFYLGNGGSGTDTLAVSQTFTNNASATFDLFAPGDKANLAWLSNAGSVFVGNGTSLNLVGVGTSSNSGTITLGGGTFSSPSTGATFTNAGTVQTQSSPSTLTFGGTFNNATGGALNLAVSGDKGQITTLGNGGTVQVATGAFLGIGNAPFTATTGYQQLSSGTLNEVISGNTAGHFGVITINSSANVSGNASLAGALGIVLASGFNPVGDSFNILNITGGNGVVSGQFTNGTSFQADGINWTIAYNPTDVILDAVSTVGSGITATWNTASGNWTTATEWSCSSGPANCVPNNNTGNVYNAVLNSAGNTLTLNGATSITINTLALQAGTLDIAGSLNLVSQTTGITDIPQPAGLIVAGTFDVNGNTSALAQLATVEGTLTLISQTINDGNSLANSGTISLQQGTKFSITGNLQNNGVLNTGNGTNDTGSNILTVSGVVTNSGALNLDGNKDVANIGTQNISGSLTNTSTGLVQEGNGALVAVTGTVDNSGTITTTQSGQGAGNQFNATGGFTNESSGIFNLNGNGDSSTLGSLTNNNQVNVAHGATLNTGTLNNGAAGTVTDYGAFNVTSTAGGAFANSGTINEGNIATFTVSGGGSNTGTINTTGSGQVSGNHLTIGQFTNGTSGVLNVNGSSDVATIGFLNNQGAVNVAKGATLNDSLINSGIDTGTLANTGTVTDYGTVNVTGNVVGAFANTGIVNEGNIATFTVSGGGSNTGTINTTGSGQVSGNQLTINGQFTNGTSGVLNVNGSGDVATIGILNNQGTVTVAKGATLNDSLTNSGTDTIYGTQNISGSLTNTSTGLVREGNGALIAVTGTVDNFGTITTTQSGQGAGNQFTATGAFTNESTGIFNLNGNGDSSTLGSLTNNNQVNVAHGATLNTGTLNNGSAGTVTDYGAFNVTSTAGDAFANSGTINEGNIATFTVSGGGSNTGTINTTGSGQVSGNHLNVNGTFTNGIAGVLNVNGNGDVATIAILNNQSAVNVAHGATLNDSMTNSGIDTIYGTQNISGSLTNTSTGLIQEGNGALIAVTGTVDNFGTITTTQSGQGAGNQFTATGLFTNEISGIFNVNGSSDSAMLGSLANIGIITVSGANSSVMVNGNTSNSGGLNLSGNKSTFTTGLGFNNSGSVTVGNLATLNANGGYSQSDGLTTIHSGGTISAPTFVVSGGNVQGGGTIMGNVQNNGGTFTPTDLSKPSTLTVTGDYTQGSNGSLVIDLGGTGIGQFSVLSISGNAILSGMVEFTVVGPFTPGANESFTFLMASSSLSGTFNNDQLSPVFTNFVCPTGSTCSDVYDPQAHTVTLDISASTATTPEPGSMLLLGTGLLGLGGFARRKKGRVSGAKIGC